MSDFSALIIDIKDSRKYKASEREKIQYFIKKCISTLNELFKPSLKFEVVFSAGDEIQGLFQSPAAAFLYYRLFNMLVSPVETRAGIGVGEWDIKIAGGHSTEQDGPVYHNARYAIEKADEKNAQGVIFCSDLTDDIFVNTYLEVSTLLISQQTEKQNQLLLLSEIMYPIVRSNTMNEQALPAIGELLIEKVHIDFYAQWKWLLQSNSSLLFKGIPCVEIIETSHIYNLSINSKDYISKIKGLSIQLSFITGVTRQNIEKMLKAGNVYQIRDLQLITIVFMDKLFSGEE